MCVMLDIANAFNTAWPLKIVQAIKRRGVPDYLVKIAVDFLKVREIKTFGEVYTVVSGCSQGSSLGPTLWNFVIKDLFDKLEDIVETKLQAYADGLVICIGEKSVKKVEREWERVWKVLQEWELEGKLKFKVEKTEAVYFGVRKYQRT